MTQKKILIIISAIISLLLVSGIVATVFLIKNGKTEKIISQTDYVIENSTVTTVTTQKENTQKPNSNQDHGASSSVTSNNKSSSATSNNIVNSTAASLSKTDQLASEIKIFNQNLITVSNTVAKDVLSYAEYTDKKTGKKMPYRMSIPKNYKSQKNPVVLMLHGIGERGTDNTSQIAGFGKAFVSANDYMSQAIVIIPQIPDTDTWSYNNQQTGYLDAVKRLVDEMILKYNGDTDRVYITGISLGGMATWNMLYAYPNFFAAAVPVCGGVAYRDPTPYLSVPTWIYHGTEDTVVSYNLSWNIYQDILNAGGKLAKFVSMEGMPHRIWHDVYADRNLFCWMFSQNRKTYQSIDYKYTNIFSIVSPENEVLVTQNDFLYAVPNYEQPFTIEITLTDAAAAKLKKAYEKNTGKLFSFYYGNTKIYDYQMLTIPKNNQLKILYDTNVRTNFVSFYNAIDQIAKVNR
ncbi:MAG: prolyl oligopeptidase family serine peptidase [Clostridia bacterium]|nr:prolyl oligopeptidase family serine peptidase [Clostridia bacterium]